jgi:ribosome-binding protein aMBF1 (putative translation factor)
VAAKGRPILPSKQKTARQARSTLLSGAFQVGVLIAIQRNRKGMRQEDLAEAIGRKQPDISGLERGARLARPLTDTQLKSLFEVLDLKRETRLREYLGWWQRHGPR